MRKPMLLVGTALLLLAAPAFAQGKGQGKGGGGGPHAEAHGGKGGGNKPHGDEVRHVEHGQKGDGGPAERTRGSVRHAERAVAGTDNPGRGKGSGKPGQATVQGRIDRGDVLRSDRNGDRVRVRFVERNRYHWQPALLPGCPPGLAKKGNGCLPPGQARKLVGAPDWRLGWYRYAPWYTDAARYGWAFDDGYAYRLDPATGLVGAFLPLIGGALYVGHPWPAAYTDYEIDPYYGRYYRYDDDYDYRYHDGVLFAVDPKTQAIEAIAALLTGDRWAVGAPMPTGYGFYNVPPPYRARYYDSPDSWYRYSDGYVYRIDPTTQVVAEAIELLI